MKITLIMVLLTCLPGSQQVDSLERQALETVQRMPVSKLDPMLPGSSFATWFNKVVGPGAGVVWQLTECGERIDQQRVGERDLNACLEADAILADGRKVVVAIGVGTFKKGFSGEPVFHSAVIEQDNQLYEIRKLHNLPQFLYSPRVDPIRLPEVAVDLRLARRHSELESFSPAVAASSSYPAGPMVMVEPDAAPSDPQPVVPSPAAPVTPQPSKPQAPQKIQEGLLRGRAMVKVMPVFPSTAKSLEIFFRTVMIAVVVSEQGRVVNAKVLRGHPILQEPALEAARKWVFEPATLNGLPIKVESILTFVFTPDR